MARTKSTKLAVESAMEIEEFNRSRHNISNPTPSAAAMTKCYSACPSNSLALSGNVRLLDVGVLCT